MEYQVPQFIEVEDKIIGPLTLRQFIYVAGTAGLCIIFFFYLNFVFALILALPVIGFGAALAFYKINGKPLIEVLEAGFNYYISEKLLLWKQGEPSIKEGDSAAAESAARVARAAPRLTRGKLSELAWSLDVKSAKNVSARTK
ncbi:MAG: PrgI family protein [Patescibacteria group bacterium]